MKKLILSAAAFLTLSIAANAQEATISEAQSSDISNEIVLNEEISDKTPVKVEELPDAVKRSLDSEIYIGWKAEKAFLIKGDSPYYEISVKNEAGESKILLLDEAGSPVKA